MTIEYVKQADTWHVVDPAGARAPKERRPHFRALCGALVHMGTYPAPIDDDPVVCTDCAEKAVGL